MSEQIEITKTMMNKLNGKLRVPIHISYIANYILKDSVEKTRKVMNKLAEDGMVVESKIAKDYYVLNKSKNE